MASGRSHITFSLRLLLIVAVLLGIVVGFAGRHVVHVTSGSTVARLQSLGADISYDYDAIKQHKIEPLSETANWNIGFDYPDEQVTSVEWNGHGTSEMNFISDADVKVLCRLPKLKRLKMGGPELTDAGLAFLAANTQLEDLAIVDASVSANGIAALGSLKRLSSLSLEGKVFQNNDHFQDDVLSGLAHLKGLAHFRLVYTRRFSPGLQGIAALSSLQTVELYGDAITDSDLVNLKRMTKLRKAVLMRTAVTGSGLQDLQNATPLYELALWGSSIDDSSAAFWPYLSQLTILNLRETQIGDAGVKSLEAIVGLAELDLSLTPITDQGVEYVARCGNLRSLDIMHTHVTDDGVRHLKRLKKLIRLVMGPHQSREVASELIAANPQLHISYLDKSGWHDIDAPNE